jgi:hypothetical protein
MATSRSSARWRPDPDYAMSVPLWRSVSVGATCRGGPTAFVLSCPAPVEIEGGTARAALRVRPGERVGLVLHAADPWGEQPETWPTDRVRAWVHGTVRGWQSWSALHQGYEGPYADSCTTAVGSSRRSPTRPPEPSWPRPPPRCPR